MVIKAAKSFKENTSAVEGIHPRNCGELSEGATAGLVKLYERLEKDGDVPQHARTLQVTLLRKPTTPVTHRCIMMYRSVHRVWSRPRSPVIRAWAEAMVKGLFNNESGRRITDGMWRSLVRRVAAKHEGSDKHKHSAQLLWDIRLHP